MQRVLRCVCVCVSVKSQEHLFVLKTLSRTQRATKVKKIVGVPEHTSLCDLLELRDIGSDGFSRLSNVGVEQESLNDF